MAPTKKPRSTNKQSSSLNEVSREKDGANSNKNKQRKKKLSDKLGSQWNKEELERFYEAYRKHGKDWKKVAAVVHNRSVEMVEALYNMNQAYLSLPEETASVVGLIAMMTDHYNMLEESDIEMESNDASGSRKPMKRKRGKIQLSVSKDSVLSQSIASDDGCLSLLRKMEFDGSLPRVVGKRTPRVPVDYSNKSMKSPFDVNDGEVAPVAALALTKAAQKGGSPQVSQTLYKRSKQKSSVQSGERMVRLEGTIESRNEKGDYARDTCSALNMEGIGTAKAHPRGENIHGKKVRMKTLENHLHDGGEAHSGMEEGLDFSLKEKVDIEVTNAKPGHFYLESQRKRSKELLSGDESSALDALQTLANVSLMVLASTTEPELSVQLNEEKMTVDEDEKSALPETSTSQNRDESKLLGLEQKVVHAVPGVDVSTSKTSKLRREPVNNTNALVESKEKLPADRSWKRKRKLKVSKAVEEANKPVNKGKHTDQFFSQAKQLKSVRSLESSLCIGQKDLRVSTAEIPLMSEVNSSTKQRGGHKAIVQRSFAPQEKSSENIQKSEPKKNLIPVQDWALLLKEKLSGCLSSYIARRWCIFEWFYSAIDYPWFSKREFMEYLNHVGLGDIPRLTRVEWSVIKSSLGKPRRFSECFLRGERQKLKQYRESVRKHYNELQAGTRDGLPTDLAKPLYVGQEVIALHSKTREIHDGSVDRVYHDMYRVQFDHPELGIKFVMDIDCMPLNPLDNMPEALSCQIGAGSVPCMSKKAQMKGSSSVGRFMTCVSSGPEEKAPTSSKTLDKKEKLSTELGNQNSGIMENQNDADCFEDLEAFNKHDGTVSTALLHSRQRNTHMANALPPWMWPQTSFNVNGGLLSTLDGSLVQELGSTVTEIIKGSRLRAHTMVDAAFQALSSTKEGEDAFTKIGQVLDCVDYRQLATNSSLPVIRSQEQVNRSFDYHNRSSSYSSKPPPNVASGQKLHNDSDKVDTQIPMELITSCVATLIMIQTSTERQCPPADVAQILDYAVTSLHPCSPRNLPLYKEIQMCMGRIKTQILALAPT